LAVFAVWLPLAGAARALESLAQVLDDDTIVVDGNQIRLKSFAAPKVAHFGEPGGEAAKAFMVELVEGQMMVCDLTQERTHRRRVGYCYRDGADIAEALVRAGLARDCPRFSVGRYAPAETAAARELPLPSYCVPR
jgi:endonuclease YncB( thermonuclease family)